MSEFLTLWRSPSVGMQRHPAESSFESYVKFLRQYLRFTHVLNAVALLLVATTLFNTHSIRYVPPRLLSFLIGGLKETAPWIEAPALEEMLKEKRPVRILDVRTHREFLRGHIPGAQWVDPRHQALPDDLRLAKKNPTPITVIYCSIGWRSADYSVATQRTGLENVYNLRGGIFEWFNESRPIEGHGPGIDPVSTLWGVFLKDRSP
ncbi:MAG: rhodanese-like domain-containing protein [Myxococcota bacterium]